MSMGFRGFSETRERRLYSNIGEDTMTLQNFKEECDINVIMRQFERTGMMNHERQFEGGYGDFTSTPVDFQEACNIVLEAERMFATVPAKVRKRFDNDPAKFLRFVDDPANLDECRQLGLATPAAEEPAPMRLEGVTPSETDEGNSST